MNFANLYGNVSPPQSPPTGLDMQPEREDPEPAAQPDVDAARAASPIAAGGYNYSLVNPPVPEHLKCILCKLLCRVAVFSGCCVMACCSSCLKNAIVNKRPCPHCPCNEVSILAVRFEYSRDEEINSLDVFCTNKEKGCGWQGRLDRVNDHLDDDDGCQLHEISCPCNCDKILQRRYMTAHCDHECPNFEIHCHYCHFKEKRCIINGEHKDTCLKFPLTCPNKCEIDRVLREDMTHHREQCPLEIIQCPYRNVGCAAVLARRDLGQHHNTNLIEHLQLELAGTKADLGDAVNKITELETILHKTNDALRIAIASSVLSWPKKLATMGTICESNVLLCPVILKMTEFTEKKRKEQEWFSPSFYSHNQGYKLDLNVDANGYNDGRGTHVSVWLRLTRGPYDDELPWPLREQFEVQILNQIKDKHHYTLLVIYGDELPDACSGRVMGNNKANVVGDASFISHEELCDATAKCQFLKDDCVYFKITKL